MTALRLAVIWDESASLSAPIGLGNLSGMYGLDSYVFYPHAFVAGLNTHENLGCAEIPTTSRPAIWYSLKIALASLFNDATMRTGQLCSL